MDSSLKYQVTEFLNCSGMTKSQFAKNVNMCCTTICEWLNGNRKLSQKAQLRIKVFFSEYVEKICKIINT